MAKCLFCSASTATGANLYRINPTGQPGQWACEKHIKNTDVAMDREVMEIVDLLTKRTRP